MRGTYVAFKAVPYVASASFNQPVAMSFSSWPPGLLYLAQTLPKLGLPLLLVLAVHRAASYNLPRYVWILAYILAVPATLVVNGVLQHLREEREIKKLGARRVPQVQTHWPGGLDALLKTVKSFSDGYIGACAISVSRHLIT
jgi:hypothetical protein